MLSFSCQARVKGLGSWCMWQSMVAFWNEIAEPVRLVIQVSIISYVIYQVYRLFHGTRGARIMLGVVVLLVGVVVLISLFELNVLGWIIMRILMPALVVGLFVVFQPELRMGLARLGSHPLFLSLIRNERSGFFDEFCDTVFSLSSKRVGALFAFERNISLEPQVETGVELRALFSKELISAIFHPKAALHDGAVIMSDDKVVAAACIFPVSQRNFEDRTLGLRHRAGVGLSEETDAVIVVVSEETGGLSIMYKDEFWRNMSQEEFRKKLEELLYATGVRKEVKVREKMSFRDLMVKVFVHNFVPKLFSVLVAIGICILIRYNISTEHGSGGVPYPPRDGMYRHG